jgi:hypothetical protein
MDALVMVPGLQSFRRDGLKHVRSWNVRRTVSSMTSQGKLPENSPIWVWMVRLDPIAVGPWQ